MRLALGIGRPGRGRLARCPWAPSWPRQAGRVGRGANAREATGEPTATPRSVALRQASPPPSGSWRLDGAQPYFQVTLGAVPDVRRRLVMARLSRLVYWPDRSQGRVLRFALQPVRRPPAQPRAPRPAVACSAGVSGTPHCWPDGLPLRHNPQNPTRRTSGPRRPVSHSRSGRPRPGTPL